MLNIRLSRVGKKKQPTFRVIVTEKGRDPWGKAREILGSYDPRTKALQIDAERVKHWLSVGATVTDSAWNILLKNNLVEGKSRNVVAKTKSHPKKEGPAPEAAPAEAKTEEKKEEAPAA